MYLLSILLDFWLKLPIHAIANTKGNKANAKP